MANKVYIRTDGVEGFFARAHETARKLDKKEPIAAETVITFEDASAMWRCLTPQRTRLIKFVKQSKGTPVATWPYSSSVLVAPLTGMFLFWNRQGY